MKLETKEIDRLGSGRNATVTYALFINGVDRGKIIAEKDSCHIMIHPSYNTLSLPEIQYLMIEMQNLQSRITYCF